MSTKHFFRRLKHAWLILIVGLTAASCTQNETEVSITGQIEFTVPGIPSNSGARVSESPMPTSLVISVKGQTSLNKKKVNLYSFNGEYISEPVQLILGQYQLVEFLVLDESDKVIYASPKANSNLAGFVDIPLPIPFEVSAADISKVIPEVLPAKDYKPKDFGYTSFSFDVVQPIQVVVMGFEDGHYEYVPTTLYILHDEDTVTMENLLPAINEVGIESSFDNYTFIIEEQGFARYMKTFSADDLMAYMSSPLEIMLWPAITVLFDSNNVPDIGFDITSNGPSKLYIDWGNGQPKDSIQGPGSFEMLTTMLNPNTQFVSITGGLGDVTSFYNVYHYVNDFDIHSGPNLQSLRIVGSSMSEVDISDNTMLNDLILGFFPNLTEVDLSNNPDLVYADFSYADLDSLDVSGNPLLEIVGLEGNENFNSIVLNTVVNSIGIPRSNLSQATVDMFIHDVLTSLTVAPRLNGRLTILEGNDAPSALGMADLNDIINVYHWTVE